MNRALFGALALAVIGSLGAVTPAGADGGRPLDVPMKAAPRSSAREAPVDARVGNLTQRPPLPGTGARRLSSASVRQDLLADRVSGTFVLGAAPTTATSSYLRVTFGQLSGNGCEPDLEFSTPTTGTPSAGFSRSGTTFRLNRAEAQAGYETWDCAFAGLTDNPVTTEYSTLGGLLTNIYAQPQLRLAGPKLLRSAKIRLVRGVWTKLDVTVANAGRVPATGVRVSGGGKGLKVKQTAFGTVYDGGTVTQKVQVKLTGKKRRAKLTLVARAGAAKAARKVTVKSARAPARPAPGTYRSKDGKVTFRVKNGKVVRWKGNKLRLTCQPPGEFATYHTATLSFPTTKIARSRIVDAAENYRRGDVWYNSWLEMRVAGKRATHGRFAYVTAGWCRASETFTARRSGR